MRKTLQHMFITAENVLKYFRYPSSGDSPTLQAAGNLHGTSNGGLHESSVEKKQRLKEQYVKLQQLQKKQRLVNKNISLKNKFEK